MENEFEKFLVLKGLTNHTVRISVKRINKLLQTYNTITRQSAEDCLVGLLKQGLSKATFNKYVTLLRHWADFTGQDWADSIKYIKVDQNVPQTFTNEEIEAFLALPPAETESVETHEKYTVFWYLMAFSGARTGEIIKLKKSDFNFGQDMFLVNYTKTKQGRAVPLLPFVRPIVQEYVESITTQHLFPSRDKDIPCSPQAVIKDFNKRLKRLGITRELRPYNFRHTAISRLLKKAKMNIFEVKRLVGHSDTKTTEKYYSYGSVDEMISSMMNDPLAQGQTSQEDKIKWVVSQIQNLGLHNDPELIVDLSTSKHELIFRVSTNKPIAD